MAEPKRTRGRPKKDVVAKAKVEVRLTEDEKGDWIKKANNQGYKTVSSWLKHLVSAA